MKNPRTPEDLKLNPPSDHPIFKIPGMNPLMLALDILHIMDHGVAQHVFAGTLHSLVYRQLKQRPYRNMQVLWGRMQELYKEANVAEKLSKFSLKMFCDPDSPHADFPKLSNAIKVCVGTKSSTCSYPSTDRRLPLRLRHSSKNDLSLGVVLCCLRLVGGFTGCAHSATTELNEDSTRQHTTTVVFDKCRNRKGKGLSVF
jgi:hypothetical protein